MTLQERREKMIKLDHDWQLHSDQSQKVFADAHGIKLFTFRYWIQKQREQENTTAAFSRINPTQPNPTLPNPYP